MWALEYFCPTVNAGFWCDDSTISYKFREFNTFPDALVVTTIFSPCFAVSLIEVGFDFELEKAKPTAF